MVQLSSSHTFKRVPPIFSIAALGLVTGSSAVGFALVPEKRIAWLVQAATFALVVLVMELAKRPMLNQCAVEAQRSFMRVFFAAIAVALAVGNGTKLAIIAGALDPSWLATGQRAFGVILGTTLALLGNYLPKLVSPWSLRDEPFDWQGVHRFGGWLCLTVGVAVVVCWLALPVGAARSATSSLILTMAVLLLGRKLYSLATWQ